MNAHLSYLWYVLLHKWFVGVECIKRGLFLQAITHDWSKFLPCEWTPYVNKFNRKWPCLNEMPLVNGKLVGMCQEWVDQDFDYAWDHHQKTQPHHWQYYILVKDNGDVTWLEMPTIYVQEMLADWHGVQRHLVFMGRLPEVNVAAWYIKNYKNIMLAPLTRKAVERGLGVLQIGD